MPRHYKFFLNLTFLLCALVTLPAADKKETMQEWPRVFFRDGVTNTIHQPQLESWDYFTLVASSVVAVQPKGAQQATFGTLEFTAKTRVDRSERLVYFEKIDITKADFPTGGERKTNFLATLLSLLPKQVKSISLDRLEAGLAILEARKKTEGLPLKNDPPVIYFSTKPAMLLLVDGQPVYRPVEKTDLERVFNSRALIVRDKAGIHYLHLFDGWLQAHSLKGPWVLTSNPPDDLKKAEKAAVEKKQVDLLAGQENPQTKKKPSLKTDSPPQIIISTVPAELIITKDEPIWESIPASQLQYATNTTSHLFKNTADKKTYVLLAGRWFRADSQQGPWEYVPGADLPKDFAEIPDESPKENVKAAVPGTHQAVEAVIANDIPQMQKVDRKTAKMDPAPKYNSDPELKRIDGTSLFYAVNTAVPVIKVNENSWYSSQNGVWFVSSTSDGPWIVATTIPAEIYSIPPSSPMHYLVYSRVYNYDDDYVWFGTTPGYYGTVVSADGVVVYGTGYYYAPYVGAIYVSYPITYGYGSVPCWNPWAGWSYGYSVGWAWYADWYWWGYCPCAPYWGPYYGYCYGAYYNAYGGITAWGPYGWAGTSGYIYHQNGNWSGTSRVAAGANAWTGNQWATQYGRAYNSATGTSVVGQRGAIHNVYTGNYAYGGRGGFYNQNSGIAGVGGKVTWGNTGTGNSGSAGRGTIYNPNTGNKTEIAGIKGQDGGVMKINDHVIAGKDGNYYRPDGNGGWEQITRPGAGSPEAAAFRQNAQSQFNNRSPESAAFNRPSQLQTQSLNNQLNARQTGAARQQSYQMNRPSYSGGGFRGGGGGGGFRGGGGGGRRR